MKSLVVALCLFCLAGNAFAELRCEVVNVFGVPTEVLPSNPNRKALLLQSMSAQNVRCVEGYTKEPMVAGVDADCPMGEGFIVPRVTSPDPALGNGQFGGYVPVQFTGQGTPSGAIVCVQRVKSQPRSLMVCEND